MSVSGPKGERLGFGKRPPGKQGTGKSARPSRAGHRPAAVLAAVLVCLLVVALMAAGLVETLLLQHRHADTELQQLQTMWLVEAGRQLAAQELSRDSDFEGRVWQITLDASGVPEQGRVEVQVEAIPEAADRRRVVVSAIWPDDPLERTFQEQTTELVMPERGESL